MSTFSQLVDTVVAETHRPDMIGDIGNYLNETIRELHFTPEKGNAIFYDENFRELQLVASSENGFTWTIPNPALFQGMQLVKYNSVSNREGDVYSTLVIPNRKMSNMDYYHYRSGAVYCFSGYGGLNGVISLGYYEYPRRLKYRNPEDRLATWDDDTGWTYHEDWDTNDEIRLDARNLSSNWILLRWADVCAEGLRAKTYKRTADDSRARTSYSLYTQLRQGLFTSEVSSGGRLT